MTTTTEEHALLRAILAEPADDTPRLVYADWLEENAGIVECRGCKGKGEVRGDGMFHAGKPCLACGGKSLSKYSHSKGTGRGSDGRAERAEFIRCQVELERKYPASIDDLLHCLKPARAGVNAPTVVGLPKGTPIAVCRECEVCLEMSALRRRGRTLFLASQGQWLPDLPGCTALYCPEDGSPDSCSWISDEYTGPRGCSVLYPVFRRGFVDSVRLEAADWLRHADALVWHPGQTVECDWCGGSGVWHQGAGVHDCPHCSATGRVPRPVPATAQPVTRVTITGHGFIPGQVHRTGGAKFFLSATGSDDRILENVTWKPSPLSAREMLEAEWPGIVFTLPPPEPPPNPVVGLDGGDTLRDDTLRALGLLPALPGGPAGE